MVRGGGGYENFVPDIDSMPSANISPEFRSINDDFVPGLDICSVENRYLHIEMWKEPSPVWRQARASLGE